ncbi:flagellar motor stator protein MotA [Donghicola sp. C2-DW-16]|uniref:Flagellar motor stator protein MotA n=1 Tax=Donghicola mangrovi TaxID=2729614 RepID=A0A850Q074_9RHOB|nr:flagellar motor stator protein MotA [Donghicola mangrovi]NVO22433.1 flagellar motor stator protein MotA [Donghicola mangrovi]NVO25976.1 flagellar motor stator protein MotA [Donghicola mangrovi]
MIGVVGIAVTFIMVFGGYLLAGGKMSIIMKSLPFEFMMIGGSAAGAFLLSNDLHTVKHTIGDVTKVFKGAKWTKQDYCDLLCLLYALIKISRKSPVDLEGHIEDPENSSIFVPYPRILQDKEAVSLICDTFRAGSLNYDDPHQVEEMLGKRIEEHASSQSHSGHALQNVADALPALGIVAAVLGVIKTMASIDQPPEVLGGLIGGALVGTFLGVFLAYGIVGPFSAKVTAATETEEKFYTVVRDVLVADLFGHTPNLCIEVGRQSVPSSYRPSFNEVEEGLNAA